MPFLSLPRLLCLSFLLSLPLGAHAEEEKVLNIYNWSDYVAEETIPEFERRTGIRVNYDVFDSNEVLEAKLLSGRSGYDIVVPSGSFLERQINAGLFRQLEKDRLANYGNLDPELLASLQEIDPGNAHAIPYMWGTNGFGYNVAMIEDRLPDAPLDSWDMFFDPEIAQRFADCGITFFDSPSEVFGVVLNYLGHDPYSEDRGHLEEAEALLMRVRPHIRYFHSSQYINDLANGDICLAMGWSGDVFIAAERAAEAGQGTEIAYTIPKEGTVIWFDLMAIPTDAPHPGNAHLFLDYILEPEVIAAITNEVSYANPNAASTDLVLPEVRGNPGIYPSPETRSRLFADRLVSPRYERLRNRTWTRFKTGR